MRIYATVPAFHVVLASASLLALGLATRAAPIIAVATAMMTAVAAARALSFMTVAQVRARGFEMTWATRLRVIRLGRGQGTSIDAAIWNKSDYELKAVQIRVLASSMIRVHIEPKEVTIGPRSCAKVTLRVEALRVGRWGIHGLNFEARDRMAGGDGLFEIPLLFANPLGVEVVPPALKALVDSPRGGRSRRFDAATQTVPRPGESFSVRELRDYVAGDSLRKVAWKASARHHRLLVREMEREENETHLILVDASTDLWAGPVGKAPLDHAIDEAARNARALLGRGHAVGVIVFGSKLLSWVDPDRGSQHASRIEIALTTAARLATEERCGLEPHALAQRVYEHARTLDFGRSVTEKPDLARVASLARALMSRAPFVSYEVTNSSDDVEILRAYTEAFGIEVPARTDSEMKKSELLLAALLHTLHERCPKVDNVHIVGPASAWSATLRDAIVYARSRRLHITWTLPLLAPSLGIETQASPLTRAAHQAILWRTRASEIRNARALRSMGVRVKRMASPEPHPHG